MLLVFSIIVFIAGAMAASSVVVERLPNSKELLDKLAPYQATIGAITLVFGVFFFMDLLSSDGNFKKAGMLLKLVAVACTFTSAVIGFLLGFPLVERYILVDAEPATKEKVENVRKKMATFQAIAGLTAMGTAAVIFISTIF